MSNISNYESSIGGGGMMMNSGGHHHHLQSHFIAPEHYQQQQLHAAPAGSSNRMLLMPPSPNTNTKLSTGSADLHRLGLLNYIRRSSHSLDVPDCGVNDATARCSSSSTTGSPIEALCTTASVSSTTQHSNPNTNNTGIQYNLGNTASAAANNNELALAIESARKPKASLMPSVNNFLPISGGGNNNNKHGGGTLKACGLERPRSFYHNQRGASNLIDEVMPSAPASHQMGGGPAGMNLTGTRKLEQLNKQNICASLENTIAGQMGITQMVTAPGAENNQFQHNSLKNRARPTNRSKYSRALSFNRHSIRVKIGSLRKFASSTRLFKNAPGSNHNTNQIAPIGQHQSCGSGGAVNEKNLHSSQPIIGDGSGNGDINLMMMPNMTGCYNQQQQQPLPPFNQLSTSIDSIEHHSLSGGNNFYNNNAMKESTSSYLKEQFLSFFQPSDNKLAMKLFGNKNALYKAKLRQRNQGKWVIHPASNFRFYWDLLMMTILIANLIILPVAITFFKDAFTLRWIVFNSISDTLFIVDIIVNFRTGVIINNYADDIILEPRRIAMHYVKTWFVLDLLSSIPIDYIIMALNSNQNFSNFRHAGRALRIIRLVKLLSLLRLLRLSRLVRYISQWEEFLNVASKFMGIFNLVLLMLLMGHLNACLQFLVPVLREYPEHSWVIRCKIKDAPWMEQYTWSLFKALSHMLCIGYGRFPPTDSGEAWITITSMMTGATCYALFVGHAAALIQSFNTSKRLYQEKFKQVEEYMAYRKLPRQLRQRIADYYEHRYQGKMFNEDNILNELSECLLEQVVNYNCRGLVASVPFFTFADHDFVSEVVMRLQYEVFQPGDLIIREGTIGQRMYFIQEGIVDIITKDDTVVTSLSDGSYFGEICLLTNSRRVASVRAATYCNIYSLDRDNFLQVLDRYPLMRRTMEGIAAERLCLIGQNPTMISNRIDLAEDQSLVHKIAEELGKHNDEDTVIHETEEELACQQDTPATSKKSSKEDDLPVSGLNLTNLKSSSSSKLVNNSSKSSSQSVANRAMKSIMRFGMDKFRFYRGKPISAIITTTTTTSSSPSGAVGGMSSFALTQINRNMLGVSEDHNQGSNVNQMLTSNDSLLESGLSPIDNNDADACNRLANTSNLEEISEQHELIGSSNREYSSQKRKS